jgi:DNA polymerase I-like protein with 3'-5' exonuclease and polymerase domains
MDIITIDFETFYDREISLSKMTTEEYIRHEQFEVIGVGVKVNAGETQWFSGTAKKTGEFLDQFPWDSSVAVAHNAMFDMAILNWHFDIRPKRIADTLSILRAIDGPDAGNSLAKAAERYGLGAKGDEVINALGKRRLDFTPEELARYGEYCKNDVELTYELFNVVGAVFPPIEFRLVDLTIRMFTEPVLELDKGILEKHLTAVKEKKEVLMGAIEADKSVLMSNPKLAQLLQQLGVVPPTKISPTTGKITWAFGKTDEGFKALLDHPNPKVQAIVAARMGVKSTLEETRTERFIRIAERGTLPVPLRYYAAHTGRWGGDDKVNLQNLPRKSPLKHAMRAPDGYSFIDCDSSQIEARTLAWLAGQQDLVEFFERNNAEIAAGVPKEEMQYDPYKIMAAQIYGVTVNEVTDTQRFVGKTTILGCLAEGTLVLTDRGWVAIEEVSISDQLWDGEEWVCHQGLVQKGIKETLSLCGLWLTPDHKVLCGTQWLEAQSVVQDERILSQALDTGAVSWLYPGTSGEYEGVSLHSWSNATVADLNTPSIKAISKPSGVHDALYAVSEKDIENATGSIYPHSPILHTENGCSTDCLPPSVGVTYLVTKHTPTTEAGVSPSISYGGMIALSSYGMSKRYPVGITQSSTWTEPTTTGGTNRVTSALFLGQITTPTVEKSASYRRSSMTYDIAYAGPRNRYTVATDAGPIIVHNCGYGMGGEKFRDQLKAFGVDLPVYECKRIISVYRRTYPMIPKLWENAGRALHALRTQRTIGFGREGVLLVDLFGIKLPNGLHIRYPNLREDKDGGLVYDTKKGRATIPTRIYGGKCVENVCQALARIVIGEQMLLVAKRLRVVMTVHDAVGCVVPTERAAKARAFVEDCMRVCPEWAVGLPLNCESKMGASYGG